MPPTHKMQSELKTSRPHPKSDDFRRFKQRKTARQGRRLVPSDWALTTHSTVEAFEVFEPLDGVSLLFASLGFFLAEVESSANSIGSYFLVVLSM
jgi:hypothetical protein